ncbi:MAG: type II toxin-antitoxin system VapC family toxin [Burkholderiales bacterium]|nr:type II toxin-antitoxin system VapC family toxin [Burkholderiales bacterium]
MGVILDTCIWIECMASRLSATDVAQVCNEQPVFLSSISLGELHFGVAACSDPALRAKRYTQLRKLNNRPILPVTADTAASFGALAAALRQTGRSPRPRYNDLWIAAQAVENDYALLTLNPEDFAGLPGLQLITLLSNEPH